MSTFISQKNRAFHVRVFCLGVALFCVASVIASPAQTFRTLVSFDGTNGGLPVWDLIQGSDGNFYGSAGFGGENDLGTVYRISPAGALTTLQSLEYSHLSVQATDGNFYGTTPFLGTEDAGTVFKMTPAGELTTLYSFCAETGCTDGQGPYGGVIQGRDGNLYGTTSGGGAGGFGTVFKITFAGKLTTLFSFTSVGSSGVALVQGTDGSFYGTTASGGANGKGSVFKVTPEGTFTTLHSFQGSDGKSPYAALIQSNDGNFYGTTYTGGANDPSNCGGLGCGTVFKISPAGKLTTLYSFCAAGGGCPDGQWPSGDLVQGTDGNFYGTTQAGGLGGDDCPFGDCGTVFKIDAKGTLTTLHSFTGTDGSLVYAGVTQGTDGDFYGNNEMGANLSCGGGTGCGSVFSLSVGLEPFVETRPTFGHVGETVTIVGTDFAGATGVTFNSTAATFVILSRTEIKATVPTGATTGTVEVTVPSGVLKSNFPFRIQ